MENRRNSLKVNGAITFVAQIIIFILGFLAHIILARVLGPTDRGVYALIILIASILGLLGTIGIESSNVYYSAKTKYKLNDIISNSLISSIGLGSAIILLFWLVSTTNICQNFLKANNIDPFHLWLAAGTVPIIFMGNFFQAILLGKEEITKYNGVSILQSILELGLIITFLVVLGRGLLGAILSYTLTRIGIVLALFLLINKLGRISFSINWRLLKDTVHYGLKGYLGSIIQFLNYRLDMFLVAYFLDVTAVGYYAIAVGMAERLWIIPQSMAKILFPKVSGIEEVQANKLTPKASRHSFFIAFILSIAMLILAKPLIYFLFGPRFLPALRPLIILLPSIVAFSLAKVLASDLLGRGRPELNTLAACVSLAVNIPLNLFLIPRLGITGAALATTVAYTLATLVTVIAFVKISRVPWRDTLWIKAADFKVYSDILSKVTLFIPARKRCQL